MALADRLRRARLDLAILLPGSSNFLGTMYSFGATLSFAIAHLSVIAMRYRKPDDEVVFLAKSEHSLARGRLADLRRCSAASAR